MQTTAFNTYSTQVLAVIDSTRPAATGVGVGAEALIMAVIAVIGCIIWFVRLESLAKYTGKALEDRSRELATAKQDTTTLTKEVAVLKSAATRFESDYKRDRETSASALAEHKREFTNQLTTMDKALENGQRELQKSLDDMKDTQSKSNERMAVMSADLEHLRENDRVLFKKLDNLTDLITKHFANTKPGKN